MIRVAETEIILKKGDITSEQVDVIVNAANSTLLGGGGVDGAIHRAGGPAILAECKKIRESHGKCPTGQAVITGAGNLPAKYVVHTVGPIWQGGKQSEPELLANAYRNSLNCALAKKVKSIAFPSISTGAYRYPVKQASHIALLTCKEFAENNNGLKEIRFCLFSDADLKQYQLSLNQLKDL